MLNIALPKGRLGKKVYQLFDKIGYSCPEMTEDNRKLVFENPEGKVRFFLVKPSDVAIYVEHGVADVGVVGKDILMETEPKIYELLDLKVGKCFMAVITPQDYFEDTDKTLRVATKFVHIARSYYASLNREIEVIKLNGSIELAPILGLSDVIVDIVETGTTAKENNLKIHRKIADISARFIANPSSFKFKNHIIKDILDRLTEVVEDD